MSLLAHLRPCHDDTLSSTSAMSSTAKPSRFLINKVVALLATLGASACCLASARAGEWKVTLHVEGATRYSNTNNEAWEALKASGPAGPTSGATQKWVVPDGERDISRGAGFLMSPTSAALWNGTLVGGGVDPTQMHSDIESSGSVSVELRWVALQGEASAGLPPSKVRIIEEASADSHVDAEGPTTSFQTIEQEVSCGLPSSTEDSGEIAPGYPWKRSYKRYSHIVDNPGNGTVIKLTTRHLKAVSKGTAHDAHWRMHGAGVSYKVSVGSSAAAGDARLTLLKELQIPGEDEPYLFDATGYDGATGIIGGRGWAGMEFQIYPHSRLMPGIKSVRLRVKEEEDPKLGTDQHPENENHVDPVLPLSPNSQQGFKWQKLVGYYGQWQNTTEPFSTPNTSDDMVFYRVLYPWNTHKVTNDGSKLWDHNGLHTVSLRSIGGSAEKKFRFQGTSEEDDVVRDSVTSEFPDCTVDVENLVITDVSTSNGTSNYFRFDPEAEKGSALKEPTIKFTIKDDGDPGRYKWKVFIRATSEEDWSQTAEYSSIKGECDSPGEQEVELNKSVGSLDLPSQRGLLTAWGTYAFDISVQKFDKNGVFVEWLSTIRSSSISIPKFMVDDSGQSLKTADGTLLVDEDNQLLRGHDLIMKETDEDKDASIEFYISYVLKGQRDAKGVELTLIKPDLSVAATISGQTSRNQPHFKFMHEETQGTKGSSWRGIIVPQDDYPANYRDHKRRNVLAVNHKQQTPVRMEFKINRWGESAGSTFKVVSTNLSPTGRGTIPTFKGDGGHFRTQFGPRRDTSLDQWEVGGNPIDPGLYRGSSAFVMGWGKSFGFSFSETNTKDGPTPIEPQVYKVKLTAGEAQRSVLVVTENPPTGPKDDQKWDLLQTLVEEGAFTLTTFNWLRSTEGGKQTVQEWRIHNQGNIPKPNKGGFGAGPSATDLPDNADAATHLYWSTLLSATCGLDAAFIVTSAHEVSGYLAGDTRSAQIMDLLNNRIGRGLAGTRISVTDPFSPSDIAAFENRVTPKILSALSGGNAYVVDEVQNRSLQVPSSTQTAKQAAQKQVAMHRGLIIHSPARDFAPSVWAKILKK